MPSGPSFDERHLQDVVLAQSGQIRPASRFSGFRAFIRPVVALAALVAIIAIALGIKDYVAQQNVHPAAGTAPAVEHTNAIARPKKGTSGKTERRRTSATVGTAEETARAASAADETEKPRISEDSADASAQRTLVIGNQPNMLTTEAVRDERKAIDRDNGVPNQRDAIAKPGSSACLPLPNGTQPQDVDAPYYFGWAKEYCGRDLSRPSVSPKVPVSQPLTR